MSALQLESLPCQLLCSATCLLLCRRSYQGIQLLEAHDAFCLACGQVLLLSLGVTYLDVKSPLAVERRPGQFRSMVRRADFLDNDDEAPVCTRSSYRYEVWSISCG